MLHLSHQSMPHLSIMITFQPSIFPHCFHSSSSFHRHRLVASFVARISTQIGWFWLAASIEPTWLGCQLIPQIIVVIQLMHVHQLQHTQQLAKITWISLFFANRHKYSRNMCTALVLHEKSNTPTHNIRIVAEMGERVELSVQGKYTVNFFFFLIESTTF
jgi:hypothetical protein